MPGLVACNRRWGIGSDDLVFPEIGEVILRVAWLIVIAAVFSLHRETVQCEGGYLLEAYYIGCLVQLVLNIIICLLIIYTAMQGTIINVWPRKRMPKFLYCKLVLVLPEVAWNCMGTYWSFSDSSGCQQSVITTVKAAVLYSWLMLLFTSVGVACVFDPLGKLAASRSRLNTEQNGGSRQRRDSVDSNSSVLMDQTSKLWEKRCRLICCCATCDEGSNEAFTDISKLLSEFFKDIDLVPTDIAAGLMLLKEEQDSMSYDLHTVTIEASRTSTNAGRQPPDCVLSDSITNLPTTNLSNRPSDDTDYPLPRSWMTVDNAAYFMKFASAVYGWPLFVFANPCLGVCQLCQECRCCSVSTVIQNDNCCQCHAAAIRNVIGIDDENILYASYHNKIYETPFFVAFDHEKQAVVVSLRGTLSLKDALTDMTADCERLDIPGVEGDCLCHRGILQAAQFVKNTLENNNILPNAFSLVQGYKLVITGHSLGAGTAALLSILLRPTYPDLICFSFSPPGGLLCREVAEYCSVFIMSVVLGKDLVPRLGIGTMEDLKVKLLRNLRDSEKAKYQILASGCFKAVCKSSTRQEEGCSQRYLLDSGANNVNYTAGQNNFQHPMSIGEALQDAIMKSGRSRITQCPLYPPGQILYITEEKPASSCGGSPEYAVQWSRADMFTQILVSPKMITDHMPDNVLKALDQLNQGQISPKQIIVRATVRDPSQLYNDASTSQLNVTPVF